jgi:dimethylhistidine N-methyltransferase
MYARAFDSQFAQDVHAGLTRTPQKTLPCSYFYDEVGSALFEAITCLAEYGLTRADARVLCAHGEQIAAHFPGDVVVAELGSGSGVKTRHILERLRKRQPVVYYPIDVSASSLSRCAQELGKFGAVHPLEADYLDGLNIVAAHRASRQTLLVLFLGSTIGNFEPAAATDFLYEIRRRLSPGDALLLGADMVKPVDVMIRAYDDDAGVTAAFNLNLLSRINRELDADFEMRLFEHLARYDAEAQRIEMHLRSCRRQTVTIRKADLVVEFSTGETIHTESCHKFQVRQISDMARVAGFHLESSWADQAWPFTENLLRAV